MWSHRRWFTAVLAGLAIGLAAPDRAQATDVDGPDCGKPSPIVDYGDAPEAPALAYPGVPGRFPTCTAASAPGTQTTVAGCPTPVPAPGLTGFVRHAGVTPYYWLKCGPLAAPSGIDGETNGKTNSTGAFASVCAGIPTDCVEAPGGLFGALAFAQDECIGGTDAGVTGPFVFTTCTMGSVTFETYNCGPAPLQVRLNILVDWNADGDWNDTFLCPAGCANEWAVMNALIVVPPGCATITSPGFVVGPTAGPSWMRISISDDAAPLDYPWNGTVTMPGQQFHNGETEDYPVTIQHPTQNPCEIGYDDYGDAPEEIAAYPGPVMGNFPTCIFPLAPASQTLACPSPVPGPTTVGYVHHVATPTDAMHFWLGCGLPPGPGGIDAEPDGKVNTPPVGSSVCASNPTDCVEPAFGMAWDQDECYGDGVDAAIASPITMTACGTSSVTFDAMNCSQQTITVNLNICVDFNQDGDWNDTFLCPGGVCVNEWAVQNSPLTLAPGCNVGLVSPAFPVGPNPGPGWLRITLTDVPVQPSFPWAGSEDINTPGPDFFRGGETEDYPIQIQGQTGGCNLDGFDFGDAPENIPAYPGGIPGRFPTCTSASAPGTQTIACPAISTPPGPTGYVKHFHMGGDPIQFWMGCGPGPGPGGIDLEADGKVNTPAVGTSACPPVPGIPTDCVEPAFGGMTFDQDECYGDVVDAGIDVPIAFTACSPASVTFKTYNCPTGQDFVVYLNVLVDMNQDGDWNDNFTCSTGCAYEWAVKNVPITLPPGCATITSPTFLVGPNAGHGWMRVSISRDAVNDDFPWAGSATGVVDFLQNGETEDYPVEIEGGACPIGYTDYGDAPEEIAAYPGGIAGHFPTCTFGSPAGNQTIDCGAPQSPAPGITGYVVHTATPTDPFHFWLGCGLPPGSNGVDGEVDGKVNLTGGGNPSICSPGAIADCSQGAFAMTFGQDECYGDVVDAGIGSPITFLLCNATSTVKFDAMNCNTLDQQVYLNILVDWNQDGDWNDNLYCPVAGGPACAPEWAVKNVPIVLVPGCNIGIVSPAFRTGPKRGYGWLRISLTQGPVPPDYPWNGSVSVGGFQGGETEDYPVVLGDPVGVDDERSLPRDVSLAIIPNPATDGTNLRLTLPRAESVSLAVYDVTGRRLVTLRDGLLGAGQHMVPWDFTDAGGIEVPVGIYLVKLRVAGRTITQRAIRIE